MLTPTMSLHLPSCLYLFLSRVRKQASKAKEVKCDEKKEKSLVHKKRREKTQRNTTDAYKVTTKAR